MPLALNLLVTFNPVSVTPETPLDQLLDMLHQLDLRHWPVVNENREVVGVVTETDLVRHTHSNMLAEATIGAGGEDWQPSIVAEIMTPRAIAVELTGTMEEAARLLLEHQIQSLPVTDRGRLTAMITASDFLREFSFGELPGARDLVSQHAVEIADTVEATATLDEGLHAVLSSGSPFIAVSRGGLPLGVVSHRELAKARCRETACEMTQVEGCTTLASLVVDSIIFRPGTKMAEAAQTLLDHNREAALVVNQANRMVGMLTVNEILRAMC